MALNADYIKHISPSEILACFIDNPRVNEAIHARNVIINSIRDIYDINSIIVNSEIDRSIETVVFEHIYRLREEYMRMVKESRKKKSYDDHDKIIQTYPYTQSKRDKSKGVIIAAIIASIAVATIAIFAINPTTIDSLLNLQVDDKVRIADDQSQQQSPDEVVKDIPDNTDPKPSAPPTETPSIDIPMPIVPSTPSKSYTHEELVEYALELINEDRAKHNLPPVRLGNNIAAQRHAEDMLRNRYLSHWDSDGFKPYMRYVQYNGKGEVSENAAMTGYYSLDGSTDCYKPLVLCDKIDPKDAITKLHHDMVYNDADSNWGHRDNILDRWHNRVNIGIAYDDYFLAFVQHFENDYIEWDARYIFNDQVVMSGRISTDELSIKVKPIVIAVFYDPLPKKMSTLELNTGPNCYSYGGGVVCSSYSVDTIYPPPPPGYFYTDKVHVADRWIVDGNYFYIESSITPSVGDGVYTVVLFVDIGGEQIPLASYSVVYKDGRWGEISTLG